MKKEKRVLPILIACLAFAFHQTINAQDSSKPQKNFKNTIHFNITNPIIFGSRSIIFGYERVINNHQSFSVNFGTTGFPTLSIIASDSVRANAVTDQKGFHVSADYRFYLSKENKYNAPRGVYIGPYYSFNKFEKSHSWTVTSSSGGAPRTVDTKTTLATHGIGFELGYQFVFWNRVTLDMILIGPGVATYNLKTNLGTNLSEEDKAKLLEKLNQALAERFPGYGWAIDDTEFQTNGSSNTTSIGFRYIVQLGFRF